MSDNSSDYSQYFEHSVGITNLMNWLARWQKFNKSYDITQTTIELGDLISGRFAIGVPKNKSFGKNVFICIQPEELLWAKSIKWSRLVIKEGSNKLYLVSERVEGDSENIPDIPAFAISLNFDSDEKISFLRAQKNIDFRELWYDEQKQQRISRSLPLWTLPLGIISLDADVISEDEYKVKHTFNELLNNKINKTNRDNSHFVGNQAIVQDPELKKLIESFDSNTVPKVRVDDDKYK